jgi:hypothetical protein
MNEPEINVAQYLNNLFNRPAKPKVKYDSTEKQVYEVETIDQFVQVELTPYERLTCFMLESIKSSLDELEERISDIACEQERMSEADIIQSKYYYNSTEWTYSPSTGRLVDNDGNAVCRFYIKDRQPSYCEVVDAWEKHKTKPKALDINVEMLEEDKGCI